MRFSYRWWIFETTSKLQNLQSVSDFISSFHSCVQEVDNMHNKIEDALKNVAEFYSPISLLSVLLDDNRKLPYRAIQMKELIS